jgi:3-methyladenine DNA glycosylase AlkD
MKAKTLADEINARVRSLPRRDTATVRALRREFSKRIAPLEPPTVLAIANTLLDQTEFLFHFIALELVHYHRPTRNCLRATHLKQLGRRLDSWYATDTFAPLLSGPAWREGQISDSVIHGWARSKDRWWRRAALVSTIGLNNRARGGRGDTPRTLAVCALLVDDRDDMVVKAMSWALRELAKHDPKAVKRFLADYKAELAARVVRETNNKLRTGLKNPKKTLP